MDKCIFCSATVRPRQEGVQCEQCSLWQHRTCKTGISQATYKRAVKGLEEITWKCVPCVNAHQADTIDAGNAENALLYDLEMKISTDMETSTVDYMEMETRTVDDDAPVFDDTDTSPIIIQEPVLKSSIEEDAPPVFDVEPEVGPRYTVVEEASKKGKPKLVDRDGFSYTFKKQSANGNKHWRCSYRTNNLYCPATVIETAEIFRLGLKDHVHPAEPGIHIAINITAEVRKNSDKDIFTVSAPCYVKQVYSKLVSDTAPHHSRPNVSNLVRAVNRKRQNSRPKDPANLGSGAK